MKELHTSLEAQSNANYGQIWNCVNLSLDEPLTLCYWKLCFFGFKGMDALYVILRPFLNLILKQFYKAFQISQR